MTKQIECVEFNPPKSWECYVRTRFAVGWEFESYEAAIEYARQQFEMMLKDREWFKLSDYKAVIKGPDGTNLTIWAEYWQ